MTKHYITPELFADKRLDPLNQSTSKVVLQLFIAKITQETTHSYHLLYGWCIITSRPEISTTATIGSFEKVYSANSINCEIIRLTICQHPEVILLISNQLIEGKSFKEATASAGINTDKVKFDFEYNAAIDGNIRIRPIIFNETSGSVSRNMFEKYSLYSPFGNTPSSTLSIVNLDKLQPFRTADGFYPDYKIMLIKVLEFLSTETKMSFATTGASRFGNIEFINGPCSNVFERAQVYFENITSEEDSDGIKVKTSKRVDVTILPNEVTNSKSLLINCFSRNGGQVILDEVKEIKHTTGHKIVVSFDTLEPISDLVVSIWTKEDDSWQIWFKDSAILMRNIVTRMGMVGATGKVSSPFLDKVLSAGTHLKNDVEKAMEVNKTSYQTFSVGGHKLDPWVEVDYEFNSLVQSIVPKKSEAVFFPKGWNTEIEEHGALAFLEWFKKICEPATNVIIQDPFFDTVGLEFLARTSNTNTSFNIITCTQTPSNDDDKIKAISIWKRFLERFKATKEVKPIMPNRAQRMIKMLASFPELFSSLKLTVNDYRNKSNNFKNLLHDRYIIVYIHGEEPKGFHLSNSIQNATQNYPLLITPIPLDVLRNVEKYSSDLLDEGNKSGTFEMVTLYNFSERNNGKANDDKYVQNLPPDEHLFAKLKSFVNGEDGTNYDAIKQIFDTYLSPDESKFEKFWDTFGYFIANVPVCDGMLNHVKDWFSTTHSHLLKQYLQNLTKDNNIDKFRKDRDLSRSGYHLLFVEDFDEALKASFRAENNFFENYGFGNYPAGYASWVLLNIDAPAFEDLLKSTRDEVFVVKETENVNGKPILRIAVILFTDLAKALFWHSDSEAIRICLSSEVMPLRTLGIAAVATDSVEKKEEMTFERVAELFGLLTFEEEVNAYVALLHQSRFDRGIPQDQLRVDCFNKLLHLLKDKENEFIFAIIERIVSDRYFNLIEAITTNNLLMPLVDNESITVRDVLNFWRLKFEKELRECDLISKNAGVLDLAGWSIYVADDIDGLDFVNSLLKISKRYFVTIRKPFMSGTTSWENDYNRLLMIQTVAMLALNYLKSREETIEDLSEKLKILVDEIKVIKESYPFYRNVYESHLFNKQIAEKDFN